MNLFNEICISVAAFILIVGSGIGIGWFTGRRTKFAKLRKRVLSLENEMLANHATILSLEKKISEMQRNREHGGVYSNGHAVQNNGHAVHNNGHTAHTNGHGVHNSNNNGHTIKNNGHT